MFDYSEQNLNQLIAAAMITAALTLIVAPVARAVSFVDKPSNRKQHTGDIPVIGGLCIYLSSLLTFIIFFNGYDQFTVSLLVLSSVVVLIGLVDDLVDINASYKLAALLAISLATVYATGIKISSLGDLFGISYPINLKILSVPLTVLAVVVLTNAYNMIDGCDGLAASLVLVAFGGVLYTGGAELSMPIMTLLPILFSSVSVFLMFNLFAHNSQKVFLGDAGSLFLGFVVSFTLIYFAERSNGFAPSTVLWFVAVPLLDFICVVIMRLSLRRSIMAADRSHIHHFLMSQGFSGHQTTAALAAIAITLLCVGVFVEKTIPKFGFLFFISILVAYVWFRLVFRTAGVK